MRLCRLEYMGDGVGLDNLCLCLPIGMSSFLWEGSWTEVVCMVVCYMAVRDDWWGGEQVDTVAGCYVWQ